MNKGKVNVRPFEHTSTVRLVLTNAFPAIISMMVVLIYNLADTFFIGQTSDELQVAAVSLATPVFLLFMAIGTLFGIGGTSVISRALGCGDSSLVSRTCSFCFWISIFSGILFIILFHVGINQILSAIGATEATWNYTYDYLIYVSWSAPFVIVSTAMSNIIRTEGRPTEAMIGVVIGTVINIVLDPIFILNFKMGITGAAWATVIGNVLSTIYFIWAYLSKESLLSLRLKDFTMKWSVVSGVLSIGIPASLNSIMMSVSNIFLNLSLVGYGDIVLASMGVSMKISMIIVLLQIGLGQGIQPLLGYFYGAKKINRFNSVLRFSNLLSIMLGLLLTTVCYIFTPQLVLFFIDSPEIVKYGTKFVHLLLISGPILGILFTYTNALQGMGASVQSLLLSLSRQGFIFIPCLFLFNEIWGLNGVILSQPVADVLSCILAFCLFCSYRKKIA